MCANLKVIACLPKGKAAEIVKVSAKNPAPRGVKRVGKQLWHLSQGRLRKAP